MAEEEKNEKTKRGTKAENAGEMKKEKVVNEQVGEEAKVTNEPSKESAPSKGAKKVKTAKISMPIVENPTTLSAIIPAKMKESEERIFKVSENPVAFCALKTQNPTHKSMDNTIKIILPIILPP